jgi:hypothetical protein
VRVPRLREQGASNPASSFAPSATGAMPAIDAVFDTSIALKWFHADGEAEVEAARAILAAHRAREVVVAVLDLTVYEVGNALLHGPASATAE